MALLTCFNGQPLVGGRSFSIAYLKFGCKCLILMFDIVHIAAGSFFDVIQFSEVYTGSGQNDL